MTREQSNRYHLMVPVWGREYVDMFVNYSLPSQLSPYNLPGMPRESTTYEILTSPADVERLEQAASVALLRQTVKVSIRAFTEEEASQDIRLNGFPYSRNLQLMTWCYHQSMRSVRGEDATFLYMTPDSILGDGALRYIHQRHQEGARAVMALGLITVRSGLERRLAPYFTKGASVIRIPPRDLVRLSLDELHPLGISRIIQDGSARVESAFYWTKPGEGLLARCFYLHPMSCRPRIFPDRMISTVDYRFVQTYCPDSRDYHVVTDSDDLFYVDMADLHHCAQWLQFKNHSVEGLARWMCASSDERHREYFQHSIRLHEGPAKGNFEAEATAADSFARRLMEKFEQIRKEETIEFRESNIFYPGSLREDAPVPPPAPPPAQPPIAPSPGRLRRLKNRLRFYIHGKFNDFVAWVRQHAHRVVPDLYERVARLESVNDYSWKAPYMRHVYDMERRLAILELRHGVDSVRRLIPRAIELEAQHRGGNHS